MAEDKTVPNVNFMLEFYLHEYKNNPTMQDKRTYYSSNKYNDYIKYVSTGIQDLKNIDYVEYANNRTKSSGIFNQNGKLNREQIATLRKDLRATKSPIWSGVVSFEEKFGMTWCNNHEQAEHILQSELPKFFKRAGLKPENMEWFAGLHENTDNRHIHLIFFEKGPIRKNLKTGGKMFSIGKLSNIAIDEFKANMELCATDYKAREIKIRTGLTKSFKEEINDISKLKLRSMLLTLANELPAIGETYYNANNMNTLRPQVDEISKYIISHNPKIKEYKNDFDDIVKEKDEVAFNYCKRNGYPNPTESVGDKMMKDIYRRLGNEVIKKAQELKTSETERLNFNAKYKVQKRLQKQKLLDQLEECLYLNSRCEYEAIKAFQDYMKTLDEMRIKTMIEQGLICENDLEM